MQADPIEHHGTAPHAGSPTALAPLFVGVVLALLAMTVVARRPQTNFADAALAEGTTSIFAERGGHLVHGSSYDEIEPLLRGVAERGAESIVLWLGNSQLHAINQAQPGDEPASAQLHDRLLPQGTDVVAMSYPNANLQEHYLSLAYLSPRIKNLATLVLPVVFDDLRETGVRDDLLPMLLDTTAVELLSRSEIGRKLIELRPAPTSEEPEQEADLAALRDTFQERTETYLNRELEERWSLWEARKEARGKLFLKLYKLRNYVFNITPQSKRPLIGPRYKDNMAALAATLGLARESGVSVLVYVAPLRTDIDPPYVASEYERFKEEVERLVSSADGAAFADLEGTVPTEYWGVKQGTALSGEAEIDFMHFQEPGHVLLTGAVERLLTDAAPFGEHNSPKADAGRIPPEETAE